MRWLKRIGLAVLAVLLVLIAGAVAGLCWLDSAGGKAWLAATVNRFAAGRVQVSAIEGDLPFHPIIRHVDLLDPDGVWATADDVELDIAAGDLWRRRLTVKNLSASAIDMLRAPVPAAASAPASKQTSFKLPVLPLDVDVQRLAVGTARLPDDIFGQPTSWTLAADAQVIGRAARLNLSLAEQGAAASRADVRFALSPERVGVTATVDDPHGLLLRRQLGEALPLQLDIADDPAAGQGGPADWHGRLTASLGERAHLNAGLHLAEERDAILFATDGTLDGAGMLPPKLRPVVGHSLDFHVALRDVEGSGYALDRLQLRSDAFTADGSGSYRNRGQLVDVSLHLNLPNAAPFSDIAGQPLAGTADVGIAAKGPLDALHADVQVQASDLAAGTIALREVTAHLRAVGLGDHGYRLDGDGTFGGIRSASAPLPGGLGETVALKLAAEADKSFNNLALTDLSVSSAGANLTGNGRYDGPAQDVAASLRLSLDALDRFAELAQPGLKGRGQLDLKVNGNLAGRLALSVQGGFEDLVSGIPAADALIGRRLNVDVHAARDDNGRIVLDRGAIDLANARLTASGEADAALQQLRGELKARVDDLAVLKQAGMPAAGRIELSATVRGTPQEPELAADLSGSGLAWQTSRIDRLSAHVTGNAAGAPSGALSAEIKTGDLTLTAAGEGTLSSDRKTLSVPRFRIRAGPAHIEARLRTALDSLVTQGDVIADIPDLRPFSTLAGQELGGRIDARLALKAERGQSADLVLTAADLRAGAAVTVHRVAANAALADLLRRPTGKLDATVEGVAAAQAKVKDVRLTAQSSQPGRFGFDTDVTGEYNGPFAFTTGGEVALGGGATRVTVARFNGRVADTPLKLQKPLVVTSRGPEMSLADLALAIGDGQVTGKVHLDDRSLDVAIDARRLPVALGAHFAGRDDVAGLLDISAAVAGPATRPQGRITVDAHDLRAGPPRRGAVPAVALTAAADIAPGQVALNAAVKAGNAELASVTGAVPVSFGPKPGMLSVAKTQPMNVRVAGDGELARIADLLPLGGDRLAGHFVIHMDVTGTPVDPKVAGNLALERGRYESLATGLLISDLAVDLAAEKDRVVIHTLSAGDGAKGRFDGQGSVAFAASGGPALDITANLVGFQALRRSDASLTASGSATITGAVTAPIVVARITVDKAEFFIPDPPPSAAKKIPVTVIDSSTGMVISRPDDTASSSGSGVATLDVAVRIPGRTFVRGRGLDSEWQGDVRVRGNSAAPEVTGALNVAKGTFSFFGKDMKLTRGTVTFTGGKKIEPVLDVLAETSNAGTLFQVGLTGTPDALKINLTSDPPLPQDEILARLIFGKEMTKLTPAEGLQLAQAAVTLSSGGPGVLDKVRQKLGLDVLSVGSMDNDSMVPSRRTDSTGGNGGMQNTGVSGGKYIANGVYVGAEQGLSGETRSKVEIEVLPHVNVESTAGTRSESFGLNWKMDY